MARHCRLLAVMRAGSPSEYCSVESSQPVAALVAEGIARHTAGQFDAAVAQYAAALAQQPDCADAWRLLGVVALQSGDRQAARRLLERALRLNGGDAAAHNALGRTAEADGDLAGAQRSYQAARAYEPASVTAAAGLARVALRSGDACRAAEVAQGAVDAGSPDAELLRALGRARLTLREYAAAADALRAALHREQHADAFADLAAAYVHLGWLEPALLACAAAREREPRHAAAWNTQGIAHKAQGAFPAALTAFEHAVAAGSEEAHINLGTTRLLLGDYAGGWPEYGWTNAARRGNPADAALPLWDGRPLCGRRLLVWPEQGIGDTLQLVRFLTDLPAPSGHVTLACPAGTLSLLSTLRGVDAFVEAAQPAALGDFDCWLPAIRLPVVFDTRPAALATAPYLRADDAARAHWRPRLLVPPSLRVGLVWSGSPEFAWNGLRSCGLAALEPLRDVPGITWFALQQGAARAQQDGSALRLVPVNAGVTDFADTAAIIAELDLVITVDTSVAHLAGALGRPAWVLLANRPDWRWGLAGERTPWYPSLRLFRQGDNGDWGPVIAAVAAALAGRCMV